MKSRFTRSAAGVTAGIRIVIFQCLRGLTPEIPAAFINHANRLRLILMSFSIRKSAWILGAPLSSAPGRPSCLSASPAVDTRAPQL